VTKQAHLLFQEKSKKELIQVWQNNNHRWLSIDDIEQSRLNIESPGKLASALDHYFLACLLFINTPNNVLLGGLGGGTLAHYIHSKQPEINGHVIEINPLITKLAKDYFSFPQNKWDIKISDIQNINIKDIKHRYDLMFIDIGDKGSTPEWLTSEKMLLQFKQQLSEHGVLVMNLLVNDADSFSQKLAEIRKVFNRRTICASIPRHNNIVVYAFNKRPLYSSPDQLQSRIEELSQSWGLDYSVLLEQIQQENPKGSGIF